MSEDNKEYEEIQLSNIWIKEHVLDVIDEINQYQVIAKIGSIDLINLSGIDEIEKTKTRLNALDLMEAKIEVLKGNVFHRIDPQKKLQVFLLLKQSSKIQEVCDYFTGDRLNDTKYNLIEDFFKKLQILTKAKEILIDACAEKGLLTPRVDNDLESKTEIIEEDEEDDKKTQLMEEDQE
jgi:hypothetical protein